jgi:hypothetical protein
VWGKYKIIPGWVLFHVFLASIYLIPSLIIAPYSYLLKALSLVVRPLESSRPSLMSIDFLVFSVVF